MKGLFNSIPPNWLLVEEYDDNAIFENAEKSFCVNIDFTEGYQHPYSIGFLQLKGQFTRIGIEDGAYATHASDLPGAVQKAIHMMTFIDEHLSLTVAEFK
ncbi:hypothetical protein [Pedobacter sp. BMA]|uniref:hypothetical protein n=1 Tax=Pedobacter sp. BMA TaxID=1663685 RepID=UPI00064AA84E|nr:hypothetical protein [Pedobacter sp. BMA]KLT64746.1 hypothetical protein AB669_13460 [Pedobacter sp. BMA]